MEILQSISQLDVGMHLIKNNQTYEVIWVTNKFDVRIKNIKTNEIENFDISELIGVEIITNEED